MTGINTNIVYKQTIIHKVHRGPKTTTLDGEFVKKALVMKQLGLSTSKIAKKLNTSYWFVKRAITEHVICC